MNRKPAAKKLTIRHTLLGVSVYRGKDKVAQAVYAAGRTGWVAISLSTWSELARFPATDEGKKQAIDFMLTSLTKKDSR